MENNPELERAERELEKVLLKERRDKNKYSHSDYLIAFAVLIYFLAGVISPFIFILLFIASKDGSKIPGVYFLLVPLAGLASLGTAIGLFRILDLSKLLNEKRK